MCSYICFSYQDSPYNKDALFISYSLHAHNIYLVPSLYLVLCKDLLVIEKIYMVCF